MGTRIAIALALVATLLLARPALAQEHEHPPGHDPGHGDDSMLPPGAWTDAEKADLHALIALTEEELPAFDDVDSLPAKGYKNFGPAPDGYYHWVNKAFIEDDNLLDPTHPESLVFHGMWNPDTETYDYELVSAMFIFTPGMEFDHLPPKYAWYPGIHNHPDVCIYDDYTFATTTSREHPNCSAGHPWINPPMMHVWIVDPPEEEECTHRFGGIDIDGFHCHVGGIPGGRPPDNPGSTSTTTTSTTTSSTTSTTSTTTPAASGAAPPATPVSGRPGFSG